MRDYPVKETYIDHGGIGINKPKMVVVHAMAEFITPADGKPVHARDFLVDYGLSAHVLIEPDGTWLRCKDDDEIAWHALNHNKNSLGVEILVPGEHNYETFLRAIRKNNWQTLSQLDSSAELVAKWCSKYDIELSMVKRHSDLSPERKVDPGSGFPWITFKKMVQGKMKRLS